VAHTDADDHGMVHHPGGPLAHGRVEPSEAPGSGLSRRRRIGDLSRRSTVDRLVDVRAGLGRRRLGRIPGVSLVLRVLDRLGRRSGILGARRKARWSRIETVADHRRRFGRLVAHLGLGPWARRPVLIQARRRHQRILESRPSRLALDFRRDSRADRPVASFGGGRAAVVGIPGATRQGDPPVVFRAVLHHQDHRRQAVRGRHRDVRGSRRDGRAHCPCVVVARQVAAGRREAKAAPV
jgi:hypothetical protein